jgi:DNA-binding NarL/FixJ family response regulator
MLIKAIVVDDSKIDSLRIVELLKHFNNIKLLYQENQPAKAIQIIKDEKPDMVFLDIEMPEMSGFDIAQSINELGIKTAIVFVTAYQQYAIKAIRHNAFDYLLKPLHIDELHKTINRFQNEQIIKINNRFCCKTKNLSEREIEVLRYLVLGKTSKEISKELFISINTVNSHRSQLLKKTKSKNIAELILWSTTNSTNE